MFSEPKTPFCKAAIAKGDDGDLEEESLAERGEDMSNASFVDTMGGREALSSSLNCEREGERV